MCAPDDLSLIVLLPSLTSVLNEFHLPKLHSDCTASSCSHCRYSVVAYICLFVGIAHRSHFHRPLEAKEVYYKQTNILGAVPYSWFETNEFHNTRHTYALPSMHTTTIHTHSSTVTVVIIEVASIIELQ